MSVLSEEIREQIRAQIPNYPSKRAVTLPALHIVHHAMHQVSIPAIREIAELLELHPSEVHDTMSFYGIFRTEENPYGKRRVWFCRSISCMLRGGEELMHHMCDKLHVHPGETTEDGRITVEFAECLGACEGAPCILVDDECHMNLDEESAAKLIEKL